MADQPLIPQGFPSDAKTVVPNIDFSNLAKSLLPQIYQNAPNFMAVMLSIAILKQELYDIIRSLTNVYNLYSSDSDNANSAVPKGVYLKMLATDLNASFSETDTDTQIFNSIVKRINFVVSRGSPISFYNYFSQNNLGGYFTNNAVQEVNNATIFFNVPVANTPLVTPNPYVVFEQDMFRLKAAGIKILVNSTVNIPYFQLGDLDGNVAAENAGFAGLDIFGQPLGGGFYSPLP